MGGGAEGVMGDGDGVEQLEGSERVKGRSGGSRLGLKGRGK